MNTTNGDHRVIIIGGGVAGLACGCYLQMNGYRTQILEANPTPGGLCAAWERGPYVFDGCLRWLTGTHPSSTFHQVWTELGAIAGRKIVIHREFLRVESRDGRAFSLSTDLDQLEQDFKRIAPEDARRIHRLFTAARRCAPLNPPDIPLELMGGLEKMRLLSKYLPMLPVIARWKNQRLAKYLASYRNPFLREVLMAVAGNGRMSALVLVMVLAIRCGPNAGYVLGGSRALARAIADRYARLGGRIRPNAQVISVKVEYSCATGVRCADGTEIPAGTVISCADGHTTIFKMLEGRFVNRRLLYAYNECEVFPPLVQASLGVKLAFPAAPPTLSLPLRRPLAVDDTNRSERLEVSIFGSDSGFCPADSSVLIVRCPSRFEYWTQLKTQRPEDYQQAKARLLHDIVESLDQRFPGLAGKVECADLATPASFGRWTGNWQGSYQGWLPTPRILGRRLPRTLPGLKNFYMAGHWVELGGGLPPAALSGRYAAQMICARDGKAFTTATA